MTKTGPATKAYKLYKAAAKFKYGPVWARAGYIQPTGQTLLAPHWSFMPGTYQGAEAGANFDYGDARCVEFLLHVDQRIQSAVASGNG